MAHNRSYNIKEILKGYHYSFRVKDFLWGLILLPIQIGISITIILYNPTLVEIENSLILVIAVNILILIIIISVQYFLIKAHITEEALRKAIYTQSELMGNVSHELRTPLNCIIGFSEILMDVNNNTLSDDEKDMIQMINKSSYHLLNLINDIIQISKSYIGEKSLNKIECNIEDLLGKCISIFKFKSEKRTISIESRLEEDRKTINVDPRLILQVLINLIGNAIKFTPEDKKIGIIAESNDNEMILTVWDEGIGIDPENLKKLFQPFFQIDPIGAKNTQGSGLGLFICKNIIEQHGGTISCESQKGHGSKFIILLPFQSKSEQEDRNAEHFLNILWNS